MTGQFESSDGSNHFQTQWKLRINAKYVNMEMMGTTPNPQIGR